MAWRHASAVLLFAALVLFASFAGASSCLPSASAVRQEHPGSWPSWTLRAPGHEGTKCWYPATSAAGHDRQIETARQTSPTETAGGDWAGTPSTRNRGPSAAPAATASAGAAKLFRRKMSPYYPPKEVFSPNDLTLSLTRVFSRAPVTTSG